jgi:NodT family efflux transporter outer membrane factor (OMF) lipoprotein
MMTAMTLIIGLLPLAFASGAGAVGNMSLGLCVIGGMTVGTLSLLFFVPLFFMFFQKMEERYMPKRMKHAAAIFILFTLHSSLFTSCQTYSNYQPQQIAADSLVRSDIADIDTTGNVVLKSWRDVFTDPQLAVLIEEGLTNNSDLRIAHLHIDAAKAELRQAKGSLFPSLELKAEGETKRIHSNEKSDDNEDEDMIGKDDTFGIGPELSWEIDIFGKMRNARKAAVATVEEKQAYAQAVRVELIATIATSYYQLEMLDAQIAETREIIGSWEESIRVQKALMAVGEATSDEVAQAEASRLEAETHLEDLHTQMLQVEHALCTVLGRRSGHIQRGDFLSSVGLLKPVDGIPVQALATRPDVRQAEANLKSAFYLTNEARAAFYPSLTIGGQVGWGYSGDSDISLRGLLTRAFGSLTMPIFAQGKLKAGLRKAKAEQEEARINFQQTVIRASQEVNDILVNRHYALKAITLTEQRIDRLNHVLQVTETRMRYESEVNFLQVLLARQSLLEARLSLLENRYALLVSHIQLYKSLGG